MLKNVPNHLSLTHDLCSFWNSQCYTNYIDKYSIYGHLLPIKEKHIRKTFSTDWSIITKASCLPSSE